MAKKNYEDFGEKIGGAKKDLWASRGLLYEDLEELNDAEIKEYVKKDNIWKKPNYQKMIKEGYPRNVVYVYKIVRDSLSTKPRYYSDETISSFIDSIQTVKQFVEKIKTMEDLAKVTAHNAKRYEGMLRKSWNEDKTQFYQSININSYEFEKAYKKLIDKKWLFTEDESILADYYILDANKFEVKEERGAIQLKYHQDAYSTIFFYDTLENKSKYENLHGYMIISKDRSLIIPNLETEEQAKNFILSIAKANQTNEQEKEKETRTRKVKYKPSVLDHVEMTGADYRGGMDVTGEDLMNVFGIRGGEFGNWLSDADSQQSLNHFYDSMMNLAYALEIDPKDISLNGKLAIAFGARGTGNALAHYEPLRKVINITKMRGAGSLGHEWIHALDNVSADVLLKPNSTNGEKFLSESNIFLGTPKEMLKLLTSVMKYELSREGAIQDAKDKLDKMKEHFKEDVLYMCDKDAFPDDTWKSILKMIDDIVEESASDTEYTNLIWNERKRKWIYDDRLSDKCQVLINFILKDKDIEPRIRKRHLRLFEDNVEYLNQERRKVAGAMKCYEKYRNGEDIPLPMRDTKYYSDAKKIDELYSKFGHGYWQSQCELLARAGASWLHDTLSSLNIRDDYLVGHSESAPIPLNGELIYTSPQGHEREVINQNFNDYVSFLKEQGLFHHMDRSEILEIGTLYNNAPYKGYEDISVDSFGKIMQDFYALSQTNYELCYFLEKDNLNRYTEEDIQRFIKDKELLGELFGQEEIDSIIECSGELDNWYTCHDAPVIIYGAFNELFDEDGYVNDSLLEQEEYCQY